MYLLSKKPWPSISVVVYTDRFLVTLPFLVKLGKNVNLSKKLKKMLPRKLNFQFFQHFFTGIIFSHTVDMSLKFYEDRLKSIHSTYKWKWHVHIDKNHPEEFATERVNNMNFILIFADILTLPHHTTNHLHQCLA